MMRQPGLDKNKTSSTLLSLRRKASNLGIDAFLVLMLALIFLAYLRPYPGTQDSPLHLDEIADYGVTIVFLLYGLKLDPKQLKAGLFNWKLHLLIHAITFLVFPLVILAVKPFFGDESEVLWLSVFYIGALPSTVSSSVVLVSIAGGNIPAAIFNASISSFLGVFITPLWMGFEMKEVGGADLDLSEVMLKLVFQVLVPIVVGQIFHKRGAAFAERNRTRLRYLDQSVILLIIYTSFCESFSNKVFSGYKLSDLFFILIGMLSLFALIYFLTSMLSRALKLKPEDRITALFCGSKKSLVQGTVMSKVLFANMAGAGLMLLPLMLYHALQLMVGSSIAQAMRRNRNL